MSATVTHAHVECQPVGHRNTTSQKPCTPKQSRMEQTHSKPFFIGIHIGAGSHSQSKLKEYTQLMTSSLESSAHLLRKGGNALDAVELAIALLEDSPITNAGDYFVFPLF